MHVSWQNCLFIKHTTITQPMTLSKANLRSRTHGCASWEIMRSLVSNYLSTYIDNEALMETRQNVESLTFVLIRIQPLFANLKHFGLLLDTNACMFSYTKLNLR